MLSKTERILFGVVFVALCATLVKAHFIMNELEEAGGIRGAVVEAGKEVKSIINEINEDDSK